MLLNLIDNAVKFTPPGGRVDIRSRRSGNDVAISIHDSGPGVALDDQSRIFERFFRADRSRRRGVTAGTARGAGLGLPIARWIAETHGGALVLERSTSEGSTFLVSLPAEPDRA
jgi:signal transduction histidine kinase